MEKGERTSGNGAGREECREVEELREEEKEEKVKKEEREKKKKEERNTICLKMEGRFYFDA